MRATHWLGKGTGEPSLGIGAGYASSPMMTMRDWVYLAGLADGEGCIAVQIKRSAHYSTGYHLSPIFQIGLSETNLGFYEFWAKELGGGVSKNRKLGYRWRVTAKSQVAYILNHIRPFVRLTDARKKIALLTEILSANPEKTPSDPEKLQSLVRELRALSKRRKNGRAERIWA
ncbi:MAG: LAGLIDADG family homing endonuclease [Nitrososphaerota archaeon]|nr:LAGLIDADG family homing endonuclease [Nitrososphaerota archaeon]